jgi:hypothetical protein
MDQSGRYAQLVQIAAALNAYPMSPSVIWVVAFDLGLRIAAADIAEARALSAEIEATMTEHSFPTDHLDKLFAAVMAAPARVMTREQFADWLAKHDNP